MSEIKKMFNIKKILIPAMIGSVTVPSLRFMCKMISSLPSIFNSSRENIIYNAFNASFSTLLLDFSLGALSGAIVGSLNNFTNKKQSQDLENQESKVIEDFKELSTDLKDNTFDMLEDANDLKNNEDWEIVLDDINNQEQDGFVLI